jgi:MerR family transcriptional regulator, heat shock protein HspR
MSTDFGPDQALFGISVAAELTGVNPQTLRTYEARGLLDPHRTGGGTRRYSGNDLERVNQITTLLEAGLNLAGIEHVLALEAETRRLQAEVDHLRARLRRRVENDPAGQDRPKGRPR